METLLYSAFVLWLLKGYTCSLSHGTLVLTDRSCSEMNNNIDNISAGSKYEPVSYDEIYEIGSDILKLLTNGQKVRLSDYGEIYDIPLEKCYKVNQVNDTGFREYDFRDMIRDCHPRDCIKSIYDSPSAGILVTRPCECIPIKSYNTLVEVDPFYCRTSLRQNETTDIYMYVIDHPFVRGIIDRHEKLSRHLLCPYIVIGESQSTSERYGPCDMQTDGTLCFYKYPIHPVSDCETIVDHMINVKTMPNDRFFFGYMCVTSKRSHVGYTGMMIELNSCPGDYRKDFILTDAEYKLVYQFMKEKQHSVYRLSKRKAVSSLVVIFEETNARCISLIRIGDRLFVETNYCSVKMDHVCRKISNDTKIANNVTTLGINATTDNNSEDRALYKVTVTLTTVSVSVFILLGAFSIVVIVVRRRRVHQRADSQNVDTLSRTYAIELQPSGSTRAGSDAGPDNGGDQVGMDTDDGSDTGHNADDGAVSGRIGTDDDESDTGYNAEGGAVPGRIGTNTGSVTGYLAVGGAVSSRMSVSNVSASAPSDGAVPGKIRGGYNCYYSTDHSDGEL